MSQKITTLDARTTDGYTPSLNDLRDAYALYVKTHENPKYIEQGREPLTDQEIEAEFSRAIADPVGSMKMFEAREADGHLLSITSYPPEGLEASDTVTRRTWVPIR